MNTAPADVRRRGLKVLARVLRRARWDDQGGYPMFSGGKWNFVTGGLPQATPAEWTALFALAGIVPDEIQPLGDCHDCKHAEDGRHRGFEPPCSGCKRPYMSNFVSAVNLKRKAKP